MSFTEQLSEHVIFAYQTDLRTDDPNGGIFTSVTGTAPNRVFNIEWRTTYFDRTGTANFELRFYENQTSFDVVYGANTDSGAAEASGVQLSGMGGPCDATTFSCQTPMLTNGLKVTYEVVPCGAASPTPTATPPAAATPQPCRPDGYSSAEANAGTAPGATYADANCYGHAISYPYTERYA